AKREGREIRLQTRFVYQEKNPPLELPSGTDRIVLEVKEGRHDRGSLTLFLEPNTLHVYNIDTLKMRAGAGTILLDWLATQAALQGHTFSIREIGNPQIFRILNRIPLLDPATVQVGGAYWPPLAPHPFDFEGGLEDPFLQERHHRARFQVF